MELLKKELNLKNLGWENKMQGWTSEQLNE